MENKEVLISIVVPVYNSEKYIQETIQCILDQTYQNWEIIFVDDCSKDKSVQIIERYHDKRMRLYQNKKNRGPAYSRNKGISKAQGRYLAYMDADDLCDRDKLEKQLRFMQDLGCAFSFTGYEFAGADGTRNGKVVHVPAEVDYEYALKHTTISTITVMFDREQIPNDVLSMPLDARGEDTATWWKILRHGYTAYGLDEPLSVYRRHGGSRSANKLDAVYGTWKMYRNCEGLPFWKSAYYFSHYIFHAVKRRI
ncbi:glycosyltransferase family 2 protein [Lachnospiraceae bacterium JLR.KK009]|jgi:Glycosyltransferases involved in cell wall biogenesis|nr:hypothetical protein C810_03820 [Lachnospiraceae bacterium A2]